MKVLTWIEKNKYPIMVAAFFLVVALLLYVFFQSLKKDHTLDMTRQELKLKEENRLQIEKERAAWQALVDSKDEFIRAQEDSLLINDLKGKNLNKQQHEKFKAINNYGSDELRDYFRNLRPTDNDY